jgi:hypothetical protein
MKGHKASRPRKMDMDRDDRPTRSNNSPAIENAAEARKSGGRAKMKRVGMVEGMKAMGHAGRKPRSFGGAFAAGRRPARADPPTGYGGSEDSSSPGSPPSRRDRAAAPTGYGGSEDLSSPGSPPSLRDRAAAPTGYGGSEDLSSPGSPPSRRASFGEGAMTGKGPARPTPTPRPRPAVAVKSGPTPGEIEADRLMAKYNTSAERSASPGEEALLRDMRAQADPKERERVKSYNTTSDLGLKRGGTARKARASGGRTGSNSAPLSSAHMGDRSPTASKEID